jgi:hypothetical protein
MEFTFECITGFVQIRDGGGESSKEVKRRAGRISIQKRHLNRRWAQINADAEEVPSARRITQRVPSRHSKRQLAMTLLSASIRVHLRFQGSSRLLAAGSLAAIMSHFRTASKQCGLFELESSAGLGHHPASSANRSKQHV